MSVTVRQKGKRRKDFLAVSIACFLLSACASFPAWRDQTLRDVAEGRWHVDPAQVSPSGTGPSQTTEFYDASERHVGYGVMSDGTMNLYGLDGSRLGSGRRK